MDKDLDGRYVEEHPDGRIQHWLALALSNGFVRPDPQGTKSRFPIFGIDTRELNIERGRRRVLQGGHHIPEPEIRRRYHRSLAVPFVIFVSVFRTAGNPGGLSSVRPMSSRLLRIF